MAELATIARPYAEALFKSSHAGLEEASVWLDELALIADDGLLQQFASDPKATDLQVFELVTGVMKTELPEQGENFVRTVIENNRLQALPEIAVLFRALKNAKGGSSEAVVYSAFPMDAAALAEVAVSLEKRFSRKLNVSVELDAALIGGIRVVVGDEVLDTSVKARLEQMKAALTA
jgi:F-type H+-transporting ATPase subunit delta